MWNLVVELLSGRLLLLRYFYINRVMTSRRRWFVPTMSCSGRAGWAWFEHPALDAVVGNLFTVNSGWCYPWGDMGLLADGFYRVSLLQWLGVGSLSADFSTRSNLVLEACDSLVAVKWGEIGLSENRLSVWGVSAPANIPCVWPQLCI